MIDKILHFLPHAHCTPIAGLNTSLIVIWTMIGLAYFIFSGVAFNLNKVVKKSESFKDVKIFKPLAWVFIFCGISKLIAALNVWVGWIYALHLINSSLLLFFQIRLVWEAVNTASILPVLINSVPASIYDKRIISLIDILKKRISYQELFSKKLEVIAYMADENMNAVAWTDRWEKYFGNKITYGKNHYDIYPELLKERPDFVINNTNVVEGKIDRFGEEEQEFKGNIIPAYTLYPVRFEEDSEKPDGIIMIIHDDRYDK